MIISVEIHFLKHDSKKVIRNLWGARSARTMNFLKRSSRFSCFIHFQRVTMLRSQIDNYQTPPGQQNNSESGTDYIYRVSQKKRNGGFPVPCELKVLYFFTSIDQTSSAKENDTKIIKFGWVVLILCPFLEIRSFSNFAGFLRPMSEELCRE